MRPHRHAALLALLLSAPALAQDTGADTDEPIEDTGPDVVPTGGRTVTCSHAGSSGALGAGLVALGLALAARRRRVQPLIALLLALLALPGAARAQGLEPRLNVQRFEPSGLSSGFVTTYSARQLRRMEGSFDAIVGWAWRPLQASRAVQGSLIRDSAAIEHLGAIHLRGAFAPTDWFQFSLSSPALMVLSTGPGLDAFAGPRAQDVAGGDLRLDLGFAPLDEDRGVGLSVTPFVTAPTGSRRYLLTDGTVTFGANVGVSGVAGPVHLAAHAGYQVKIGSSTLSGDLAIDDEILYGAGVGFLVLPNTLRLNLEAVGSTTVGPGRRLVPLQLISERIHTGVEANGSFLYTHDSGFNLLVGGGAGLTPAPGVPAARAFLGLGYTPPRVRDRDDDGIEDGVDACPDDPEDLDGFEDFDGCPDLDHDGDGIPDVDDLCPDEAEDLDGVDDEDGCPDGDDDGDGIPDGMDDCPEAAEDLDGFLDDDGCPDPDNDGDGFLDTEDDCPDAAEDVDGHDDLDGCPESRDDRDGDGVPDDLDPCPDEPEDVDGWQDDDGCPEADNDGDGFLDGDDLCPNVAETVNGFADDDGCPDQVQEGKAILRDDRIEITEMVQFFVDEARIRPESYGILDDVVTVLKDNPQVRRIRIEGHTDSQGSDSYNQDLSERRALSVRSYLVEHGISSTRVLARGFGERYPIAPNSTDEGRAQNRRVEFLIVDDDDDLMD